MLLPELHVGQQSRREKLRVPPPSPPSAAAFHHIYDASVFPPPFDLTSSAVAGCVSDSSPFFNQFGGGGSGIWKGADWVLHNGPSAPFLNASPQIYAFETHKQLGDLHFTSLPCSPYSLHDVVSSSSSSLIANHGLEISSLVAPPLPPLDGANELLLLPSYAGNATSVWTTQLPENGSGKGEGVFCGAAAGESTQSLVLSLSSNPPQVAQMEERFVQDARFGSGCVGRGDGGAIAEGGRQVPGPLGPFTGYATVLKSSKFLKPAQQLLDEFCGLMTGSRSVKHCDAAGKRLADGNGEELSGGWGGAISAASSSSVHSSTEVGGKGSAGGPSGEIHRPAFEQKKAKLLYIQEEVCRRYKQYQQQMQLVVYSFESIAGLSSATPYATLALKTTSKHFQCLKNAISDQLRHVCKVLGDERMDSCPCSSKIDPSDSRQKPGDSRVGCSDKHPIWRPQRGLPERAISVLRAWLFDHFLHPYPTDTDKHMLAMQTGLSRNQVSNWFINARVRLWKPMVEEIHMLETRGMSAMDLNSSNKKVSQAPSNKQTTESSHGAEQWHPGKKSRMENCDMDGGLMSFAYQGRMGIGGLGAVSLTLGLRQGEGSQQNQQQRKTDLGHQILHDFVG